MFTRMTPRRPLPGAISTLLAATCLVAATWALPGCLAADETAGASGGGTANSGGATGIGDGGGDFAADDTTRVGGGMDRGGSPTADDGTVEAPRATLHFTIETGDDGGACAGTERCVLFTQVDAVRVIEIRYAVGETPIAGEVVKFKIEEDHDTIGYSSALSAYTDEDGVARAEVGAVLAASGQFVVRVHVDDQDVTPIFFDIVVVAQDFVPLTVVPSFDGLEDVASWGARLFHQDVYGEPSCGDVHSLQSNAAPDLETKPLATSQTARFLWLPNLEADGTQPYTALALGYDADGVLVGWGCLDAGVEPAWGESLSVDLPLEPRPPQYVGAYDATLHLDLNGALSDEHREGLADVAGFLADPVAQMTAIACAGKEYADPVCAVLLPPEGGDPAAMAATVVGEVIAALIGQVASELADEDLWEELVDGTTAPADLLGPTRLHATLSIAKEPTNSADTDWAGGASKTTLTGAALQWGDVEPCDDAAMAEEECGWSQVLVSGMQESPATGVFIASLDGLWGLDLGAHEVSLQPSALVDGLWQAGVLPQLFDEDAEVDSHADLVRALLAGPGCLDEASELTCCAAFADELHRHPAWPMDDIHTPTAAALITWCESAVDTVAGELSARIRGPALEAGETFTLTGATGCSLSDADGDMSVDAMGSEDGCSTGIEITVGGHARSVDAVLTATVAD